jgi:hypothetical protein
MQTSNLFRAALSSVIFGVTAAAVGFASTAQAQSDPAVARKWADAKSAQVKAAEALSIAPEKKAALLKALLESEAKIREWKNTNEPRINALRYTLPAAQASNNKDLADKTEAELKTLAAQLQELENQGAKKVQTILTTAEMPGYLAELRKQEDKRDLGSNPGIGLSPEDAVVRVGLDDKTLKQVQNTISAHRKKVIDEAEAIRHKLYEQYMKVKAAKTPEAKQQAQKQYEAIINGKTARLSQIDKLVEVQLPSQARAKYMSLRKDRWITDMDTMEGNDFRATEQILYLTNQRLGQASNDDEKRKIITSYYKTLGMPYQQTRSQLQEWFSAQGSHNVPAEEFNTISNEQVAAFIKLAKSVQESVDAADTPEAGKNAFIHGLQQTILLLKSRQRDGLVNEMLKVDW